ncbi:unnamed protein product [Gongylonema pulchrum]|uniref:Secreted protein n=1 Tax=Gongylonema pulchrum TaxID=637853 RepID=A0A183DME0_9BILA|nr:unnamed protein product [Gongylonema pulchrum]
MFVGAVLLLSTTVQLATSRYCHSVYWETRSTFIQRVFKCDNDDDYCASMVLCFFTVRYEMRLSLLREYDALGP